MSGGVCTCDAWHSGQCYCAEMTYREANDVCDGCGGHDGDCYCGED